MSKSIINKLAKASLVLCTGAIAVVSQNALAETTGYNQISYSVDASQMVKNDEVTAVLYKQVQAKTPKLLANELNSSINQALKIANRYPTVTTTTGSQNSYPRRNKNGEITGWQGSVSVNLQSKDFDATSELIASLQNTLVVQDLRFGVSKQKRKEVEQALMIQASKSFKEQAKVLKTAWDTSGYKIVAVTLNTNGGQQPYAPRVVMESYKMSSPPQQRFEGGDSEISVVANGTIELIPWLK